MLSLPFFCPSTWHGRRLRRTAGAVLPFQMEAKCFHLERGSGNGRFCGHSPFLVEGRGQSRLIISFPGFPPGTDVAAGGPPEPIGRSGWRQNASTWNSDIGNGRFCCHPPFQVKGRGRNRLIIALPAFHWARSSPLGDRRCRCSFLSFHRARSSPLEACRCHLAVPGGSK